VKSRALLAAAAAVSLLWTLAAPAPVRASDDAMQLLPQLERSLWEGWKNHDAAPFEKNLAEGAISTNVGGLSIGKAANVAAIRSTDCVVAGFSVGEIAVHRFGDSTAILTYSASQDATCKGQKVPADVLVTSVWVMDGGRWLSAAYHESPAPKAP
jgi:hypothetical protein